MHIYNSNIGFESDLLYFITSVLMSFMARTVMSFTAMTCKTGGFASIAAMTAMDTIIIIIEFRRNDSLFFKL